MSNRYRNIRTVDKFPEFFKLIGLTQVPSKENFYTFSKRAIEDSMKKGIHVGLYLEAGSWITEDQGAKPGFGDTKPTKVLQYPQSHKTIRCSPQGLKMTCVKVKEKDANI